MADDPNFPSSSPPPERPSGLIPAPTPSQPPPNGATPGGADYSEISAVHPKAEIAREKTAARTYALNSAQSLGAPFISPLINPLLLLLAIGILIAGLILNQIWVIAAGSIVTLLLSLNLLWPTFKPFFTELFGIPGRSVVVAWLGLLFALVGLLRLSGINNLLLQLYRQLNWDAVGALGEVFGALGQILIAVLAVYVAWRQYVISKDLTVQQNIITQQQTIDTYFQGISDLVLDEEGLLEDWPQERAIAEGRTAAIFSSVDGSGKAKILRFLSRAKLLTPLKRDQRLGRAILDGVGGYAEDRLQGVRVIDLAVMLAGADLSGTDLRWTDLSEANLIRADMSNCDLVKANLSRTILVGAKLRNADFTGTRLFYGAAAKASPRSRTEPPDYKTGARTGAVVENADFTGAQDLSEDQRYYCCAWGGTATRKTIPGGCEGIPNKLTR